MSQISKETATKIYQILVTHEVAKPQFEKAFVHDQTLGPTPLEWDLKAPLGFGGTFYRGPGPAGPEEWVVRKNLNDERVHIYRLVDRVNLDLAILQNEILP